MLTGINHTAWLLEISRNDKDLYPESKQKITAITGKRSDMFRPEMITRFAISPLSETIF